MKNIIRTCFTLVFSLACASAFAVPILKSGDRLLFLGDSITAQQIYTRYVTNFFAQRYPDLEVSFRNAGKNNDTAAGGLQRLESDVLSQKPTVVSICYGMNDGEYAKFNQQVYDRFISNMRKLTAELKKAGIRVVLLTPGCVDTDRADFMKGDGWNYNDTLGKLAEGVKKLAAEEKIPFYDLHTSMLGVQKKAKKDKPGYSMITDGNHPIEPGHAVMAYALLKALGCAEQASGLAIDAQKGLMAPDRCAVADFKQTETEISFTRTDESLPLYFDQNINEVTAYFPLHEDLNQYRFTVTGLKAPTWKLTVEGADVGTFTKEELAKGVNLATHPGPWEILGREIGYSSLWEEYQSNRVFYTFDGYAPVEGEKAAYQAFWDKFEEFLFARETVRRNKAKGNNWHWVLTAVR